MSASRLVMLVVPRELRTRFLAAAIFSWRAFSSASAILDFSYVAVDCMRNSDAIDD